MQGGTKKLWQFELPQYRKLSPKQVAVNLSNYSNILAKKPVYQDLFFLSY